MKEELYLTEDNEQLFKLLSALLETATRILHNEAMLEAYIKIGVHQSSLEIHTEQGNILRSALVKGCSVFFKHIRDEGQYGWSHSQDIALLSKIASSEFESIDLIQLLEFRTKLLEKIILINSFEIIDNPLLPMRKVS